MLGYVSALFVEIAERLANSFYMCVILKSTTSLLSTVTAKSMSNADTLSRPQHAQSPEEDMVACTTIGQQEESLDEAEQEDQNDPYVAQQQQDPAIGPILAAKEKGCCPILTPRPLCAEKGKS